MLACLQGFSIQQIVAVSILLLVFLFFIKKYFNGGLFSIPKGLSLSGKYALITGANTGIGKETLREMARLQCHIIFGARDRKKSEEAVKEITEETNNRNIEYIHLDLADRQSIESFAKAVSFPHIDYLVNNAGVMSIPEKRLTKEGNEMHWAVNHLGHFYLTFLLWEKISKSPFFRIINVSSLAHKKLLGFGPEPKMDFEDMNFTSSPYEENLAYSRSKLCNGLFTASLASKIGKGKGLTAFLHPGVVRTELIRQMTRGFKGVLLNLIHPLYLFFTKSPSQGNQTTMFCLLSEEVQSGQYYADCKKDPKNSFISLEHGEKLWALSEANLGVQFKI